LKRISILNFKGGTGKSSLTESLAYALALRGRRVLVIDCDRQHNSSTTLLGAAPGVEPEPPTLTQVLKKEVDITAAIRQAREGLDVIPADTDLDTASSYLLIHHQAFKMLGKATRQLDYDYILYDHAGAYTPVMEAALLASDEMLIPVELEAYAVQGLFSMFQKLEETLEDHEIKNSGIIPYAVDMRFSITKQYLDELREEFGELLLPEIRTDGAVTLAQSNQQTIFEYEAEQRIRSRAADDFRALAERIDSDNHRPEANA
jgi:chromosome partitioning protein